MLLSEGLYIALAMERRGINLYSRAARLVKDESLKELLSELEVEERVHFAKFKSLLSELEDNLPDDETLALAAAKAADGFFPGGVMQMSMEGALKSRETMLESAIEAEVNSVAFYEKLAEGKSEEQRKLLLGIAEEEKKHRDVLRGIGCEE